MKDYNEPTLENIFRTLKNIERKVCPWGECEGCSKRMQDTGYGFKCYECKQGAAKADGNQKVNIEDIEF